MTFVTKALQEVEADEVVPLTQSDQAVFERLWQIDDVCRLHAGVIEEHISSMDKAVEECDSSTLCTMKALLLGDQGALQEQLEGLRAVDVLDDKAHEVWKTAIQKSIEQLLGKLGASGYTDVSKAFEVTDPRMKYVDTGVYCTSWPSSSLLLNLPR